MQYYGNRLSENISRREPEGYLLCLNVPVARTGTQDYLPEELGITPGSFSFASGPGLISVYRPEEEVFAHSEMESRISVSSLNISRSSAASLSRLMHT